MPEWEHAKEELKAATSDQKALYECSYDRARDFITLMLAKPTKETNYLRYEQVKCVGCTDGEYDFTTYHSAVKDMGFDCDAYTSVSKATCRVCAGSEIMQMAYDRISEFVFRHRNLSFSDLQNYVWCNACQQIATVSEYSAHLETHEESRRYDTAITCICCYDYMNMGEYLSDHQCRVDKCSNCKELYFKKLAIRHRPLERGDFMTNSCYKKGPAERRKEALVKMEQKFLS